jgi:hypothetical protein
MKIILYYLFLLIFIALLAGFLLSSGDAMTMPQMIGIAGALALYTIAMSLIGESNNPDERDVLHRNLANRFGLLAGTIVFSAGIVYQIFITHNLDWWLVAGLIVINLTKILSLIYLNYKR